MTLRFKNGVSMYLNDKFAIIILMQKYIDISIIGGMISAFLSKNK